MSYKIAVASTDGKVVNEHFGRARQFLILEIHEDGTYEMVDLRRVPRICDGGSHEDEAMRENIKKLSDCKYVLVSRIGPGAENMLEQYGISAFAIIDYVEDAINKLISYVEINNMIYGG